MVMAAAMEIIFLSNFGKLAWIIIFQNIFEWILWDIYIFYENDLHLICFLKAQIKKYFQLEQPKR